MLAQDQEDTRQHSGTVQNLLYNVAGAKCRGSNSFSKKYWRANEVF